MFDVGRGLRDPYLSDWINETRPAGLAIKPVEGRQGRNTYIFPELRYENAGINAWSGGRGCLLRRDILSGVDAGEGPCGFIVQEYLRQHPELNRLNGGKSVNTVRIVTCIRPTGEVRVLGAVLRYATKAEVDNWHRGGVAAPVDLTTRRIGPGLLRNTGPRATVSHAVSND